MELYINEIVNIAQMFEKIRNRFVHNKPKRFVPESIIEFTKSKNFKFFYRFYLFAQKVNFTEKDIKNFIVAQFKLSNREIFPQELTSKYAFKRYFKYLKLLEIKKNKNYKLNIEDLIQKDLEFLKSEGFSNIEDCWNKKEQIDNVEFFYPVYLFLKKKISPYLFLTDIRFIKELKKAKEIGLISEKNYKFIIASRERRLDENE